MKMATTLAAAVLTVVVALPVLARGESAQQAYQKGQTLLSKGDFNGALKALAAAARADGQNQEYMQRYAMVRRVLQLQQKMEAEKDPQRWLYMARALHAFYIGEGLLDETAALDRKIHAKFNDTSSATLLAETELALNNNAEAADVLKKLEPNQSSAVTQALLGIALARQGKMDDAKRVTKAIVRPADVEPRTVYTLARLHAVTGDSDAAMKELGQVLESVPPSIQVSYREHATRCPDFRALAGTKQFAQVLKTESKIPESRCSGGQGCAGCPNRGQCPKAQGQSQSP